MFVCGHDYQLLSLTSFGSGSTVVDVVDIRVVSGLEGLIESVEELSGDMTITASNLVGDIEAEIEMVADVDVEMDIDGEMSVVISIDGVLEDC